MKSVKFKLSFRIFNQKTSIARPTSANRQAFAVDPKRKSRLKLRLIAINQRQVSTFNNL